MASAPPSSIRHCSLLSLRACELGDPVRAGMNSNAAVSGDPCVGRWFAVRGWRFRDIAACFAFLDPVLRRAPYAAIDRPRRPFLLALVVCAYESPAVALPVCRRGRSWSPPPAAFDPRSSCGRCSMCAVPGFPIGGLVNARMKCNAAVSGDPCVGRWFGVRGWRFRDIAACFGSSTQCCGVRHTQRLAVLRKTNLLVIL